jgi:HEAT repeat protein
MPREQLGALTADVDRLLAAGAAAAAGNDDLGRRANTLRDMGQKVAALLPVADAVDRAKQASPNQAAPALLDLVVLCRQIRASLAGAGVAGDLKPLPESGPWRTPLPVRDVQPLVHALTKSGPGREDLLKSTLERNALGDLRLMSGLLEALEDGYAPIAELVAREALPSLGRPVLSELVAGFNPQGKIGDARRLLAICRIDASTGATLCRRALSEGSQVVRVQALERLPDVARAEEAEQAGLSLRLDVNRDVRAAAIWSLRVSASDRALEALVEALLRDADEHAQHRAADALSNLRNPRTTQRLLGALEALLQGEPESRSSAKKGSKKASPDAARGRHVKTICLMIEALANRRDEQRLAAADALLSLATSKDANVRCGALAGLGAVGWVTPKIVSTLSAALADKNSSIALSALTALTKWPPAERNSAIPSICRALETIKVTDPRACQALHAAISMLPNHVEEHGRRIFGLLAKLVEDKDVWKQSGAFEAIARIGPPARSLLPKVLAALKTSTAYWPPRNGNPFVALDPDGNKVIPEAMRMLADRKVRRLGLHLLTLYGGKAKKATPLVSKLCQDSDQYLRKSAEETLAAIQ